MKEGVLEDWIENGMPCLACGERVQMAVTVSEDMSKVALRGCCKPCKASPIGENPMLMLLE